MRSIPGLIFIVIVSLSSCQQDKHNIVVSGIISTESGAPIPDAEVVVLCWFMHGLDEASFEKQTLTTDKEGKYTARFSKGHQIDVASKAPGFQPGRLYHELKNSNVVSNLQLSPTTRNPSLVALLNTSTDSSGDNDSVPLIKVRIYSGEDENLNLDNMETYGFDMKTLTINKDTTECDFWFSIERKNDQPGIIRAHGNGGIIPVYIADINSTFLFEKPIAPETGYVNHHLLNGSEEGFFVRCRDGRTFGKIILEKSLNDLSSPDGRGGWYKEFVRRFSCLYQPDGTTDLSYSQPDIDLEDFLVDHRLQ